MTFPPIVYFGTPQFAAEILEFLIERQVPIAAIVTQPDRPKGRSLQMASSPVKAVAERLLPHVPIFQPVKCSNPEFLKDLSAIDAKLFVVVAFGQILPKSLLEIPPLGCINVHPSLLPKFRGAAPIRHSLLNGDRETGVSIQRMVRELDAGDVIAWETFSVPEELIFGELEAALCELAKPLLLRVISSYAEGMPAAIPQDPDLVTLAPKIEPEQGEIHWRGDAQHLHNLIRAFSPRPGAWSWVEVGNEKKRLKIYRSKIVPQSGGEPGTLLSNKELIVACGRGSLHILEVQPDGKPRMPAADWLRGARLPLKFTS